MLKANIPESSSGKKVFCLFKFTRSGFTFYKKIGKAEVATRGGRSTNFTEYQRRSLAKQMRNSNLGISIINEV